MGTTKSRPSNSSSRMKAVEYKSRASKAAIALRTSGFNYGVLLNQKYPGEYAEPKAKNRMYAVASGQVADVVTTERLEALVSELCNQKVA